MILKCSFKKTKRNIKSKSVTTFTFGILLGRYAAFEIDNYRFWSTVIHFGHNLILFVFLFNFLTVFIIT